MSENNEQTCRSCRHYAKDAGECRRQPPKAVKKDAQYTGVWPQVADDRWCGEYKTETETAKKAARPAGK